MTTCLLLDSADRDVSLNVAVLCGGDSSERAISLQSGRCVAAALHESSHRAILYDPAVAGICDIPWSRFDACFVALHGGAGENGNVQHQLDEFGVPYTGSGPTASRLAISKSRTKRRLQAAGLPVADGVFFERHDCTTAVAAQIDRLGYPVVIKPDGQGCSLGVRIARTPGDLESCIATAARFERSLLAERWIEGREYTVAVLDRQALPVLEIGHAGELFDYSVKFGDGLTDYRIPPSTLQRQLQQLALHVAETIGTRSIARMDLIVDNTGQPYVLEANTVPGMTEKSLVPRAGRRAGLSMAALCDVVLRRCLVEKVMV